MRHVGHTLRWIRTQLGWSQRALAARATTSDATVCRIERGEQDPTLTLLRELARALGVPLRDLVDPLPAPSPQSGAEARTRLADLMEEEAAWERSAPVRTHRPLSAMIARRRLYGASWKTVRNFAAQRRVPESETVAIAEHTAWGERIERDRQRAVLDLVAAGGLFSHPAVRHCYREARRLRDAAFLRALGAAVAIPPPITRDKHRNPVTNRGASRLE
jgi:transcriptional regulator with XRE-family HTH domain